MTQQSFEHETMRGARFHDVELNGASFHHVDLTGATFTGVSFEGVRMRSVDLIDVDISGDVGNLVVNGVDVAPLVEAELDRRDPDRPLMRPEDADGFRAAYELITRRWEETVERARGLDPALLHESVGGEWSFVQTLRHLSFATAAWLDRAVLGVPRPWHPLDLPWDDMTPTEGVPWDRDAQPSLEEVLAVRAERVATVRGYLADLTDEALDAETPPCEGPGWPPEGTTRRVRGCLRTVLNEEYQHRLYAERDLAALGGGGSEPAGSGPHG